MKIINNLGSTGDREEKRHWSSHVKDFLDVGEGFFQTLKQGDLNRQQLEIQNSINEGKKLDKELEAMRAYNKGNTSNDGDRSGDKTMLYMGIGGGGLILIIAALAMTQKKKEKS